MKYINGMFGESTSGGFAKLGGSDFGRRRMKGGSDTATGTECLREGCE